MLPILYHDDHVVVVAKPAGLLVHRSLIDRHETRFALQVVRDQLGQKVYPVHRLDRPTSGVLVFALDAASAQQLAEQFSQQQVDKTYHALVRGFCAPDGVIDYALKEELDAIADAKATLDKAAQPALTHYRSLVQFELPFATGKHASSRYTWLELRPKTGRKHQLRRHLKHIFHPIVGDTTHGDGKQNRLFRQQFACERLLLHAAQLRFKQPSSGAYLTVTAPLPPEITLLLSQLARLNQWPVTH